MCYKTTLFTLYNKIYFNFLKTKNMNEQAPQVAKFEIRITTSSIYGEVVAKSHALEAIVIACRRITTDGTFAPRYLSNLMDTLISMPQYPKRGQRTYYSPSDIKHLLEQIAKIESKLPPEQLVNTIIAMQSIEP